MAYSDHQTGYLHPDHLMVNEITVPAFHAAGDPSAFPEAGDPWAPSKLYYTMWAKERLIVDPRGVPGTQRRKSLRRGVAHKREGEDHLITAKVDTHRYWDNRCDALLAHATQVDPNEGFWFPLPREIAANVYPWDDYELAISTIDTEVMEYDLFEGLRRRDRVDDGMSADKPRKSDGPLRRRHGSMRSSPLPRPSRSPGSPMSCALLYVITDAPDGKFAFFLDLASGAVTSGTAGRLPRGEKAGVTITVKEPILLQLWSGELSRDAAFMAGDIKVEGAYEVWLDQLVPAFENDAWSATWAGARSN